MSLSVTHTHTHSLSLSLSLSLVCLRHTRISGPLHGKGFFDVGDAVSGALVRHSNTHSMGRNLWGKGYILISVSIPIPIPSILFGTSLKYPKQQLGTAFGYDK